MTPDEIDTLIREVNNLLAQSDGQRELIDAVLRAFFTSIQRVTPQHQVEVQELVMAYMADPDDKEVKARLGALLQTARLPDP